MCPYSWNILVFDYLWLVNNFNIRRWYKQWPGWVIRFVIGTVDDFLNIESSVCVTPRRRAFRDIAPILFLSSAVSWPEKAGRAYTILDMIRPVNNICNAWTFMPCDLSCDNRYKRWFICISILFTYAEVERVEVMSIPSKIAWVTRSMSDKGGGGEYWNA